MEFITQALAAVGGTALLLGAATWLMKKALGERIEQAIRAEYSLMLERAKAEHATSLEGLKDSLKVKSDFSAKISADLLARYWNLGERAGQIFHDTSQLLARIHSARHDCDTRRLSQADCLREINAFFEPESIRILQSASALKNYYVLLPVNVIVALQAFEMSVWRVLKAHQFNEQKTLTETFTNLLHSIRIATSRVLFDDRALATMIGEAPEHGFLPQYIRDAFSDQ